MYFFLLAVWEKVQTGEREERRGEGWEMYQRPGPPPVFSETPPPPSINTITVINSVLKIFFNDFFQGKWNNFCRRVLRKI